MMDFLKQGRITLEEVEKSIKELPLPEKVKAIAIYKRYRQIKRIEDEMEKATREIEKNYLKLDDPVLNNVAELVSGQRAIREDEIKDAQKYLTEEQVKLVPQNLAAHKIDGYWWKCLNAASMIKEAMGKDDEQLLKHLEKIHVVDEPEGGDNFTIVFSFAKNEVIENTELTVRFVINDSQAVKTESSEIKWTGKNLTMKEIKKKQKNKKTGQQRVVTRQVKAKSFFTFFRSIDLTAANPNPLEASQEEMKLREDLETDYEIAGVLVDEVLPYSLEYYLGIDHEGDEGFGGSDEEDEDEDDDEDDGDKKKKKKKNDKSGSKSKSKSKSKDAKEKKESAKVQQKPECKNQ